jgi:exosortase C (VPDSG-CTERM-specific)
MKPAKIPPLSTQPHIPDAFRKRLRVFSAASCVLIAAYATTLWELFRYSMAEDLFSYILLVPLVSGYLITIQRKNLEYRHSPALAATIALGAISLFFIISSFLQTGAPAQAEVTTLSLRVLAFVSGWIALALWILGGRLMSQLAFPAVFLVFLSPLPPVVLEWIEAGLQHASAEVTAWLFPLLDIPNYRVGLSFQLPNLTIAVAPECSGIRSSLVLFITSLVAGYLLLERPWQRAALTLLVIPLGILRNAVRIVTLGWLCTHHGPEMIHSAIHHRGGPFFFALSLIPLLAMLVIFRLLGKRKQPAKDPNDGGTGSPHRPVNDG